MTVATRDHRIRLDALNQRRRAAQERMNNARRAIDTAGDDSDVRRAGESALIGAQGELETVSQLQSVLLGQLVPSVTGLDHAEGVFDDPGTIRTLEQMATSSAPIGNVMLGPVVGTAELVSRIQSGRWGVGGGMYAADPGGGLVDVGDAARLGPWRGVVPQLRRRLRLLDLIPTAPMTEGNSFQYTQEFGSFETAVETAELAMKPEADAGFDDAEVVAKTIAHWFKTRRQQLADVPSLQGVLTQRLVYGVLRRVENQVLAGNGAGENLRGILNTSGIADVPFSAGEPLTDLTLDAITDVLVSEAEPNGVVANPVDVATMLKAKAAGSGERLDSDGGFATPPDTLWGLPLIMSTAMAQGTALVGDFAQGATVFVREGVSVRLSDSDQDDFVKNRVTLLGEGRFGLAVWQPTVFALVNFA